MCLIFAICASDLRLRSSRLVATPTAQPRPSCLTAPRLPFPANATALPPPCPVRPSVASGFEGGNGVEVDLGELVPVQWVAGAGQEEAKARDGGEQHAEITKEICSRCDCLPSPLAERCAGALLQHTATGLPLAQQPLSRASVRFFDVLPGATTALCSTADQDI
jgi:hypothetical protein